MARSYSGSTARSAWRPWRRQANAHGLQPVGFRSYPKHRERIVASINPRPLLERLNPFCRRSLIEGAIALCMSRSNYNVEIEHWLAKLLEGNNTDLTRILKQYDINPSKLNKEV